MREIKYRVWIPAAKKMVKPTALQFNDSGSVWATVPGLGNLSEKFCELMQYTGLDDNNGCEVYEGDIIAGSYPNNQVFHGEVFYEEMAQAYRVRTRESWYLSRLDMCHDCEVIGNIYDNPELLQEADHDTD